MEDQFEYISKRLRMTECSAHVTTDDLPLVRINQVIKQNSDLAYCNIL